MKNGPTTVDSETAYAPCSSAAACCADASCLDAREPSARNGCGTGRSMPRSGQVPTTTAAPRSASATIASVSWRTETATGIRWVTSLPPTITTATSGRYAGRRDSSWQASALPAQPTAANLPSPAAPRSASATIASVSWRTDSATGIRWVTSLPPTITTATSGRYDGGRDSIWPASALLSEPTTATLLSRTERSVALATYFASRAPRV